MVIYQFKPIALSLRKSGLAREFLFLRFKDALARTTERERLILSLTDAFNQYPIQERELNDTFVHTLPVRAAPRLRSRRAGE